MKENDILYCINDIYFNNKLCFIKNKGYIIEKIYFDGEISIKSEIWLISFKSDDNFIIFLNRYYIDEKISDYFINQSQLRKQRLEKLYEIQKRG